MARCGTKDYFTIKHIHTETLKLRTLSPAPLSADIYVLAFPRSQSFISVGTDLFLSTFVTKD